MILLDTCVISEAAPTEMARTVAVALMPDETAIAQARKPPSCFAPVSDWTVEERGRGIKHPFRKKEDDRPTTETAPVRFDGLNIVLVKLPGMDWTRTTPALCDEERGILGLLGLDEPICARPPPR